MSEKDVQQPVRRVGSITMALSLIVAGCLLLARAFLPWWDLRMVFRCAPVVLVGLGVEMLWANRRHPDVRLKYDGLSVVYCLLLIGAGFFFATAPAWAWNSHW